ncbi:MAG TPA: tetratricopeptide repeat protein [Pyrinomonadaceae bacterium]|nr:tetratricopeptide repeat protein [Pyrinomonadaceae bacterium]
MSVQDLPTNPETSAEPDDVVIRRLVRALDYAEGFWLGFAKSNTYAQRRRVVALCKDLLEPLKIRVVEIELTEPVADLLPILRERLAQERDTHDEGTPPEEVDATASRPKFVIFVYGLEHSIPSKEAHPPLLSSLNLNRELFQRQAPHPLVLWMPDYALTALARKAPDFWAWRSGLYEFTPERETTEQALKAAQGEAIYVTESLSEQAKRERLVMLKGLLDDYRELGDGSREQEARASILNEIGLMYQTLGKWAEAEQAHQESLTIFRNLKDSMNEAVALHNLGRIVYDSGKIEEARRLYDESLEINKMLGDQSGVANTLHELGRLAHTEGDLDKARRLYDQSLEINKGLSNQSVVAVTLYGIGMLAENEGDKAEAARLFREALSIFERLGSPKAEIARRSLARVEGGDVVSD